MKKTQINPFDSKSENRHEAFRQMRTEAPVHETSTGARFIVSQQAVSDGLKSVESFVGSFGNTGQTAEEDTVMAAIAEPRHAKIRKLFNSALGFHHVSKIETFVRNYCAVRLEESLELTTHEGEVEIMESFARRLPSAIIAKVLGIPGDRTDDFARWSDELLKGQGATDAGVKPVGELHPEFSSYLKEQITLRLDADQPPDDMMTRMLYTEIEGERLSPRAVLTQCMFLIIAGNETTRNLIGNLIHRLAGNPGLYQQIRDNRELIPTLIEESLRIDSPVQLLARTCTADVEIDGIQIREGDRVLHSIASANRDESLYPEADQFKLDRPRPREHVAFGAGPHICPGAFLARMEAEIAIETLVDRVAQLGLAPDYTFDPNPVFWALGPQTLRVTLKKA
jgi:cytochrome P450